MLTAHSIRRQLIRVPQPLGSDSTFRFLFADPKLFRHRFRALLRIVVPALMKLPIELIYPSFNIADFGNVPSQSGIGANPGKASIRNRSNFLTTLSTSPR